MDVEWNALVEYMRLSPPGARCASGRVNARRDSDALVPTEPGMRRGYTGFLTGKNLSAQAGALPIPSTGTVRDWWR